MHLPEAQRISNGVKTLVAVIDSGIDSKQPEIADTITGSFDAIDGGNGEKAIPGRSAAGMVHGTEIAGIIASHAELPGVAPQAHLLAVRAFAERGGRTAVAGTAYDFLAGTEWAVKHKARFVNMSFAGRPPDADESSVAGIVDAYAMLEAVAAPGPLGENAAPIIEQRSAGLSDSTGRPTAKGAELPQNPPPVDQNPTGSLKADAQPDSKSLPTRPRMRNSPEEKSTLAIEERRPHLDGPISAPITGSRGRQDNIHK